MSDRERDVLERELEREIVAREIPADTAPPPANERAGAQEPAVERDGSGPLGSGPRTGDCTTCGTPLVWAGRNPQSLQCPNLKCPVVRSEVAGEGGLVERLAARWRDSDERLVCSTPTYDDTARFFLRAIADECEIEATRQSVIAGVGRGRSSHFLLLAATHLRTEAER